MKAKNWQDEDRKWKPNRNGISYMDKNERFGEKKNRSCFPYSKIAIV